MVGDDNNLLLENTDVVKVVHAHVFPDDISPTKTALISVVDFT